MRVIEPSFWIVYWPNNAMSAPPALTPLPFSSLDSTLGALYVGNVLVAFFCGITSFQTYVYFVRNPKDNLALKSAIFILWVIDMVHLAFLSHSFYIYTITNYANPLALLKVQWGLSALVALTDVSDAIVRGIFAHRIWSLSGHNYFLTALIAVASLVVFVSGMIFSVRCAQLGEFLKLQSISWLMYLSLGTIALADIIIAASLCILLKKQVTVSKRTQSIMRTLMLYSINASALTSIFSIACLVTYATMPDNLVFLAIYVVIPKLYFNSLLAMLNSRKALREHPGDPVSIPLSQSAASRVRTFATDHPFATGGSIVSGIQIETITDRKYDREGYDGVPESPGYLDHRHSRF
ncbi:unnamed protein product [Somion occarium]|uniref:DUF6534 domain-containing protein n=1 Tax=Somion occarium TaxID=3059160 RepID=A0ABP1DVB7_9APHY